MSASNINAAALLRVEEQLRQERETFDQRKEQEAQWFLLRLRMGYAAVILLPTIILISTYILFNYHTFPATVVTAAGGALFADVVGLIVAVWKVVLNPGSVTKLEPLINERLNGLQEQQATD